MGDKELEERVDFMWRRTEENWKPSKYALWSRELRFEHAVRLMVRSAAEIGRDELARRKTEAAEAGQ